MPCEILGYSLSLLAQTLRNLDHYRTLLPLSFDYCSRSVYVYFLSFLPCRHFKAKCLPENWPVKYSALQVRKVCFPTDHLTTRNWKQALRQSTYWLLAFQCLPITTDALLCILHMRYFLVSKQIRKSWYSKTLKKKLHLYTRRAIQVQEFWRKPKKLRLFSHNKSLKPSSDAVFSWAEPNSN